MNQQWLFPVLFAVGFAVLLVQQHIRNSAPEYIAPATVVSRRTEPAKVHSKYTSGWNYLVTFQLSDGSTLELYAGEAEFRQLTEGLTGTLRWQNEDFRHFDPQT